MTDLFEQLYTKKIILDDALHMLSEMSQGLPEDYNTIPETSSKLIENPFVSCAYVTRDDL